MGLLYEKGACKGTSWKNHGQDCCQACVCTICPKMFPSAAVDDDGISDDWQAGLTGLAWNYEA